MTPRAADKIHMPRDLPDRSEGRRCRVCGGTGQTFDPLNPQRGPQVCRRCGGQGREGGRYTKRAAQRRKQRSRGTAKTASPKRSKPSDAVQRRLRDNKVREITDAVHVLDQAAARRPEVQQQARALRQSVESWGGSPTLAAVQQAALQAQLLSDAVPTPGDAMQNPVGEMLDLLAELLGLTR